MTTTEVLVVYPFMHHYRAGVFREMDQTPGVRYTFASDVEPQRGIDALPTTAVDRHVFIRHRRFGKMSWQSGLLTLAARGKWDAVIFLGEASSISTWLAAGILRLRSVPVLFWTIGWHRPERGIKRLVRHAFYRLSDKLLLYGNIAREIGREGGFPDERMAVIGNSVESPATSRGDVEEWTFQKEPGVVVVGAVIRLTEVKRLDLLLRAVAELTSREDGRRIAILLVGDGPEREPLRELADSLGVELTIPGAYYGSATLEAVYDVLDVTVVPAAVGLTAIQSMAHGVPVISDDARYRQMPEWEAIRPGVTGEIYAEGDVAQLADAIERVLRRSVESTNDYSEECRDEVSQRWTSRAHAGRIAVEVQAIAGGDAGTASASEKRG